MIHLTYRSLKRLLDIVISLVLIVLSAPVLILSASLVNAETKGGIFYLQQRLGYRGRIFSLLKFRSMTPNRGRDASVQVNGNEDSITRIGRLMRRTKIDELPQLFNVLKGDMSLVGPRPCLPQLQEQFNEDGRARLLVRPGITGLAQVSGNIHLSWEERWKLDRAYVEHLSFDLDLEILLRTISVVLLGDKWGVKK